MTPTVTNRELLAFRTVLTAEHCLIDSALAICLYFAPCLAVQRKEGSVAGERAALAHSTLVSAHQCAEIKIEAKTRHRRQAEGKIKFTSSDGLQPNSNGIHPNSDGKKPNSKGLHHNSDGLQPNSFLLRVVCKNKEIVPRNCPKPSIPSSAEEEAEACAKAMHWMSKP